MSIQNNPTSVQSTRHAHRHEGAARNCARQGADLPHRLQQPAVRHPRERRQPGERRHVRHDRLLLEPEQERRPRPADRRDHADDQDDHPLGGRRPHRHGQRDLADQLPGAGGSAGAVVLARADSFPDALAGTPLAAAKSAPLLLTGSASLDSRTMAEIQRVLTPGKTVFLLGGSVALSPSIANALGAAGYAINRFDGVDRFDTAMRDRPRRSQQPDEPVRRRRHELPRRALSRRGRRQESAARCSCRTASSAGARSRRATSRARPSLSLTTVGGPAATAYPAGQAIVGVDRYDTSAQLAARFFPTPGTIGLASGTNFPDALAGGAHIARFSGPMLLTDPSALPAVIQAYLTAKASSIAGGFLYGGTSAVSDSVRLAAQTAIGGSSDLATDCSPPVAPPLAFARCRSPRACRWLAPIAVAALTFTACSDDSGSSAATTVAGGAATTGCTSDSSARPDEHTRSDRRQRRPRAARRVPVLHQGRRRGVPRPRRRRRQHEGQPGQRRHDPRRVRVQRPLGGRRERRVGEREARARAPARTCRATCSTSSRTGSPGSRSRRSTISVMVLAPRCSPAATSSSSSCSPAQYELDVAAGPNKTLDEVVALARETIPKLPEPPNSD